MTDSLKQVNKLQQELLLKERKIITYQNISNTSVEENDFLTDDEDDENIDPNIHKSENSLLKKSLRKKEKESEKLHEKIQTLEDKLILERKRINSIEEKCRRDLKTIKSCSQLKHDEREKLLNDLKIFINKQESQIHQLQQDSGEEILFSFSNSLNGFVSQISDLQDAKVELKEENIKANVMLEELKCKCTKLEESIITNYVPVEDYTLILKQNEVLMRMKTPSKVTKISFNEEHLKRKISSLEVDALKCREQCDTFDKQKIALKKQVMELESKCTTLMYAPPKIHIRNVVDESTEEKLRIVEDEKYALQMELRKQSSECNLKIYELNDKCDSLINTNERLEKRDSSHRKECQDFLKNIKDLQNIVQKEKLHSQDMKREVENKSFTIEACQMQSAERQLFMESEMEQRYTKLKEESRQKDESFSRLLSSFQDLSKQLKEFKSYKDQINHDLVLLNKHLNLSLCDVKEKILHAVNETNNRSNILSIRYKKEIELRKQLHDQIVELKGNIRVFCRVRPIICEDGEESSNIVSFDGDDDSVMFVKHKGASRSFHMDRVFEPTATQGEVFEDVKSLVTSCLDGYNICIFAYGQTGSGKTFTMEGNANNPGINQLALRCLFSHSEEMQDWKFTILVSFVEIYNEMLRDLLSVDPTTKLNIKHNKDGLHVPGLTHVKVSSVHDVNEVFSLGRTNRITACTNMNERSSRSHSVLTVTVIGENSNTGTQVTGKLNLVDLAGSERVTKSGSEGLRMKEAQCINKSLSALGDVIHALKNKNKHIPYRNTKLTYMLQDSLGGDSKTLMVVQVSPVDKNSGETLCSLNFAQRVREVELGMASRKVKKSK